MFKWLFKKRSSDPELLEIKKIILDTSSLKTNSLNVIDIRKNTINTHFSTVDDYLNSIKNIEILISQKKKINKTEIASRELYLRDLEGWLKFHSYKTSPISQINQLICTQLTGLIRILESIESSGDVALFSYYKRLNSIHFKDLHHWNLVVNSMLKYKYWD